MVEQFGIWDTMSVSVSILPMFCSFEGCSKCESPTMPLWRLVENLELLPSIARTQRGGATLDRHIPYPPQGLSLGSNPLKL
jgi:hypothetical protein